MVSGPAGLADAVDEQFAAVGLGANVKGVRFGGGGGGSRVPGGDNHSLANSDTANTAHQNWGELFKPSVYGPVQPPVSTRIVNPVECLQPVPEPTHLSMPQAGQIMPACALHIPQNLTKKFLDDHLTHHEDRFIVECLKFGCPIGLNRE